MMIYILEDNEERIQRFRMAAAVVAPDLSVRIWSSAHRMVADLVDGLEHASIISLDHDLNPVTGDSHDPGCGCDVVKLLADLLPCCPVVVHTSNSDRGAWMIGELSETRWPSERVYPIGEDWIERDWTTVVKRLLGKEAPAKKSPTSAKPITSLHVGGLVALGFDQTEKYLLAVSHDGRGVFDVATWRRVARDPKPAYPENGFAVGIGPIDGQRIAVLEIDYDLGTLTMFSPSGDFELSYKHGVVTVSTRQT